MAFPKHKRGVIVYRATNRITGDFYIGVTGRPLKVRRCQHVTGAKSFRSSARKLAAAIRAYGEDAFDWDVVAECGTGWEANVEEVRLIAELRPAYNIAPGGIGGRPECSPQRGWHYAFAEDGMDAADRARLIAEIDARFIERRRRAPRRQVAAVGADGRDKLGRSAAGPMTNARPVMCLSDGANYPSASAAAAFYGVAKSALIEMCLGKNGRVSVGGLAFRYVESAGAP